MSRDPKLQLKTNENSIYNFTTKRPVAILMVVLGVLVFGYISYYELPLNLMPEMTYPSLTVRTEYPGTAPEEVETAISRPVEQALGVVDNLVSISSVSKAEQSDVILDFTWDTDMDKATADVREKLDQVFLPDDAKRPLILRFDPSLDPIMKLGLYGKAGLTYLRYVGDEQLKRELETIDGVAAVKIKGGLEEEIRVELNEKSLTLLGMDIQTVRDRLSQENVNLAGGNLKEGQTEYLVRTLNEFKNVKSISNLVIGRYNNVDVRIKDVGRVLRTYKKREIITRIKGKESVDVEIYKEADANIVDVAKRVKARLYGTPEQKAFVAEMAKKKGKKPTVKKKAPEEKKQAVKSGGRGRRGGRRGNMGGAAFRKAQMTNFIAYRLPKGVNITTLTDQSLFIESSVREVINTALMGGLLAILVLFIFLRRLVPTVIIALSIPISIIATFAPMKIFGVSLNVMSLGGLALGVGMLVDNSIVVLESIARCREDGDSLIDATLRGVKEVGGAVIASTLTTIAVFFPIVFVQGVAGQVFGDMALTIVFSLLASLAVALFLIPMLSSRETQSFLRGAQIDRIPKDYILDIPLRDKIDRLFSMDSALSGGEKFIGWINAFIQSVFTAFKRIFFMLIAMSVALIKLTYTVLLTVLVPVLFLLHFVIKDFRYTRFVQGQANNVTFMFFRFSNSFWEDYARIKSSVAFVTDMHAVNDKVRAKKGFAFFVHLLLWPIKFLFYTIKYMLYVVVEILYRIVHAIIMILGLFIYMFFLLARLIFTPITRIIVKLFDIGYGWVERQYPVLLEGALNNKFTVLGIVGILFVVTIFGLGPRIGSELIPEVHQGEFYVDLRFPVGTPVERTDKNIMPIADKIADIQGVEKVSTVSGTDKSATSDSEEGENTARLTVTIKQGLDFETQEDIIINKIRDIVDAYSGVSSSIARPTLFSFKTPIEVHLKGYNLAKLQKYSSQIKDQIAEIPGIVDAKSNLQRGNPEVQIFYNRKLLARQGLNVKNVATIIRNKVRGDVATEFKEEDRKIDVLVRIRDSDKESIDDLKRMVINPGAKVAIPLSAIATIRINEGPSEIRRVDQQRSAVITANVAPGYDLKSLNNKIYNELLTADLPNDFAYELAGQSKEMETSLNSLMLALGLAIFLVYIVMASQFESLIHPFIIIFTIPLALIGVVIFLYILNIPLSIVVFLGLIMLAGIVVNNAIVLVDYINFLREKGLSKMDAIIKAGQTRLRPILMTTTTTVLGLLPMALGIGDGAEIRTPMAITVIVGLSTATLLTLIVIPTVYSAVTREKIN